MQLTRRLVPLTAAALVLVWLGGCTIVPETGRHQLILIPPAQEMELGMTAFEQTKKEVPINRDPALNAMVQRVGQRIAAVAQLPNARWEFVVFQSPEANAFCLPDGKVGVYTGILPVTRDEAGLATVLGHEVAHAAAHHGAERMSEQLLLQQGGNLVNTYFNAKDPKHQATAATLYGLGAQLGLALPHSRKQESEADRIGLLFMASAGYDPDASVAFWQRFAQYNKGGSGGPPWFLRTHPLDEQRIRDLQGWLPQAKARYQAPR